MAIDNAMLYAAAQRERTALEAALGALRENEERLLLAMDAGRLAIWDWDLRYRDKCSGPTIRPRCSETSGARSTSSWQAIHPDDRRGFLECIDRAIEQKSYFECEFRDARGGRLGPLDVPPRAKSSAMPKGSRRGSSASRWT